MCGICGFIGEVDDSKKVLKQMMDKIAHRGPDDEGMYVDKHAAIGHRRLSIIDLNTIATSPVSLYIGWAP